VPAETQVLWRQRQAIEIPTENRTVFKDRRTSTMNLSIRRVVLLSTIAALLVQPLRAADDAAKAQKLINRAIESMGGIEALNKTVNTIIDDKGTYYGMGEGVPYEGRYVYNFSNPGRYRMEIIGQFIMVTDKDKAWMSMMGMVIDQEGEGLELAMQGNLVNYAMSLIPLQKPNKTFKLSMTKAETIDGEKCRGIQIEHKKMPTITMHFSKKTGFIKNTKYKLKDAQQDFKEVTEEAVFFEYKEFDGFMSSTKIIVHRDGKKFVDSYPQKVTYPDKLDENEFKRPE
jgi:hypothetical protein